MWLSSTVSATSLRGRRLQEHHSTQLEAEGRQYRVGHRNQTRHVAVRHPVARGSPDCFWDHLGRHLRETGRAIRQPYVPRSSAR